MLTSLLLVLAGVVIGVLVMALCIMAGESDRSIDRILESGRRSRQGGQHGREDC
jgi:hypothetical protein